MSLFRSITHSGTHNSYSHERNRAYVLTNYVALTFIIASFLLFLMPQNHTVNGLTRTVIFIATFAVPIALNRFVPSEVSRLYLCWVPLMVVIAYMISNYHLADEVEPNSFDGLRMYLLGMGSMPYLLFHPRRTTFFILAVLPGLFCILFCDSILDWAGVIPHQGDVVYSLPTYRSWIVYVLISGSCLSLKIIVTQSEGLNKRLLHDLNIKNDMLRHQQESEVKQLNEQLRANLDALERREFTLRKSQEIAKVGSWEYSFSDRRLFMSDETYDILAVAPGTDLRIAPERDSLFGSAASLLEESYHRLVKNGHPADLSFPVTTPIGYRKWVRVYAYPVVDGDLITGLSGIVHDITLSREAEEIIRTNERKYRSLFEQATDAIMITDMSGRFLNVNQSMCAMLGYNKEELLQLSITDLIDEGQLKSAPIQYDLLKEGGHVFSERVMRHKDGTLISTEANVKMFAERQIMAIVRNITERKQIEKEKEYARYLLRERIKELTALYRSSQLLSQTHRSVAEILQDVALVLPEGWQYPSVCAARVSFDGASYISPGFVATSLCQTAVFKVQGREGAVDVVYLEERPEEVEGPFLYEERNLINVIAEMIQVFLSRKSEEDELNRAQANLEATINNTEIMIWSTDRHFKLLTFNKPFFNFIREKYSVEIKIGERVLESLKDPNVLQANDRWTQTYMRVLAGEVVTLEDSQFGMDFRYSLTPIIEGHMIIGISAFADNVTERNIRDRALTEANKKIAELKVMSLRSMMNPHFIFNVLNSIQYFIVKNDRLNAINYLSTFSKLIRNVLMYSLNDRIRLTDEIEMLKDYVHLETIRFENKFGFVLDVQENVDADHTMIPSLLIQPFVENAILHGLYNKVGTGLLTIKVSEEPGYIIFTVEDDGVGREAALRLREKNPAKHTSVGSRLTEERLRLIDENPGVSVEYTDLVVENASAGTRVKIRVKAF